MSKQAASNRITEPAVIEEGGDLDLKNGSEAVAFEQCSGSHASTLAAVG
jgi:hypothetical protein